MFDPVLELQKAVRERLIRDAEFSAIVNPQNVRTGTSLPANLPCVNMASPRTVNLGNASGNYRVARVTIDLHIWAQEAGSAQAQRIGAIISNLLWDGLGFIEADYSGYERPSFIYMRDPDPTKSYNHGVGTVEVTMQWAV